MNNLVSTIINFLKKREVILFFLLFLLCSLGFGLGYLYAKDYNQAPIIIEKVS